MISARHRREASCLTDGELVDLARAGDQKAYDAIVRRYQAEMHRYCRRLARSETAAEEAVQQALVSAWLAFRDGAEVRELRAWLYRIAHNAVIRTATRERDTPCGEIDHGLPTPSSAALAEQRQVVRDVLTAVRDLPAEQRAALVGTTIQGHSREYVAVQLGVSAGAVRQLVYRARITVKAAVAALAPPSAVRMLLRRLGAVDVGAANAAPAVSAGTLMATAAKVGIVLTAMGGIAAGPGARLVGAGVRPPSPPEAAASPSDTSSTSLIADAKHDAVVFHPSDPASGSGDSTGTYGVGHHGRDRGGDSRGSSGDDNSGDGAPGDDSAASSDDGGSSDPTPDGGDPSASDGTDPSADPVADPAAADPAVADPPVDPSVPVDPAPDPALPDTTTDPAPVP